MLVFNILNNLKNGITDEKVHCIFPHHHEYQLLSTKPIFPDSG